MNDQELPHSADHTVAEARSRVEGCRAELQALLGQANAGYRSTLLVLEGLASRSPDAPGQPLEARIEALRRSQELNQMAAEYDGGIGRLNAATDCLDEAIEAIEGRMVQRDRADETPELTLEAVAIQAQEEERYRLAREIHDGPAQILANVALQLEYISKLSPREQRMSWPTSRRTCASPWGRCAASCTICGHPPWPIKGLARLWRATASGWPSASE